MSDESEAAAESAKAIQEVAKTGGKAIDVGFRAELSRYFHREVSHL